MRTARKSGAQRSQDVEWSQLYTQLHRFVSARVRSASDANDLVQVILERAMSKAPEVEVDNIAGWLFGIARNAVVDHYRAQARAFQRAADALEASAVPPAETDEERRSVIACMEPLLDTMNRADSQLLRWADMEGRPLQSIADELGISLTATKSRVQRARKAFVKTTRECCAITRDARGRVTSLTPRPHSCPIECAVYAAPATPIERLPS
jgi:RNA polymerase sigma-70 factor (ECF subfamily)